MRRGRLALLPLVMFGLLAADTAVARAQTQAILFDPTTVKELRLLINSRDLVQLRKNSAYQDTDNSYFPVDVVWGNLRVRNAAVRPRGSGTRNSIKMGLRLDFNRYATGQQFVGLNALDLDNLVQDESMIREQVAMAFFARMGQPSSRESFCRLFINNVYQGLYALVEEVDTSYLARTTGENGGYLFEYHHLFDWYGTYLGDDLAPYKAVLEAKTHELEPDATVYGPIRDLFREVNGPDDAVWRDRVDPLVDLNQFVTFIAIENFLAEYDGIVGNFGMNNFYLYRPAGSTRHRFLPWDRDNAMLALDSSIFKGTDLNVLFVRAMNYPDLRTLYLDVMQQCAEAAIQDDWLASHIAASETLISDLAHHDPLKPYTNETYDTAVQFLTDFAAFRPGFALLSVALARGSVEQ